MAKPRMVSPNELFEASKRLMIEGREPKSDRDWQLLVNFWAANVACAERELCKIMKMLYHCPLSDSDIESIADYQVERKRP